MVKFIFLSLEVVVDYQTCVICMEDLPPDQVIFSNILCIYSMASLSCLSFTGLFMLTFSNLKVICNFRFKKMNLT